MGTASLDDLLSNGVNSQLKLWVNSDSMKDGEVKPTI